MMKKKEVKVYFCPKCRSFDVGFVFALYNLFGVIPKMRCKKCGFSTGIFPLAVIKKSKLKMMNKNLKVKK